MRWRWRTPFATPKKKSALPRAVHRMRAHRTRYATACRRNGCHVAAVRDVSSAALLVRLQAVGSNDVAVVFRDEDLTLVREPVRERALFAHIAWKGVCLACPDDGLHDRPDGVRVSVGCGPDQHPRILPRLLLNAGGPPDPIGGPAFHIVIGLA